jgi:type II secretory pathway component PulJ
MIMKRHSGFTLLELILFMTIAGVTMGVIVFFLVQINRLSTSNDVATTIDQEGLRIQETLTEEIATSKVNPE